MKSRIKLTLNIRLGFSEWMLMLLRICWMCKYFPAALLGSNTSILCLQLAPSRSINAALMKLRQNQYLKKPNIKEDILSVLDKWILEDVLASWLQVNACLCILACLCIVPTVILFHLCKLDQTTAPWEECVMGYVRMEALSGANGSSWFEWPSYEHFIWVMECFLNLLWLPSTTTAQLQVSWCRECELEKKIIHCRRCKELKKKKRKKRETCL